MAQISLRVDDAVKKSAEKACEDIGMSMSTAINIFLKKLGRERRIPFEVTADADPFYSDAHIKMLESRIADMNAGRNVVTHELIGDDA